LENVEILNIEKSLDCLISDEKKNVVHKTVSAKNLAGWMDGWLDGWMDGWVGGWMAGKAGLG
jgi:hypothetical protein